MAERTFTNQQGAVPCFICGEMIPGDMESTWDRSPAKRGKCHITCLAERNIAERNGAAKNGATENVAQTKPKPKPEASAGGWLDGLAEQLAPYIEDRISTKLDRDQVDGMVRDILKDAVMLTVTKVIVETKATGETKDMGIQHKCFPDLMCAATARDKDGFYLNVWLVGPAGTGKSTAPRKIAEALTLRFFVQGALCSAHEMLGYVDGGGTYHRTAFREAWEHGGVFLKDEIDADLVQATMPFNGALANGLCTFPDSPIPMPRHKDCVIIAAANTWGLAATRDYCGRNKMDAAFLNRFVQVEWPIDEALELATAPNREWCLKVQAWRKAVRAKGISGVMITPRATYYGAALIANGASFEKAAAWAVKSAMSDQDWSSIQ